MLPGAANVSVADSQYQYSAGRIWYKIQQPLEGPVANSRYDRCIVEDCCMRTRQRAIILAKDLVQELEYDPNHERTWFRNQNMI